VLNRPDHQRGADEQQDGNRDLGDDQ
jgi:hypothetical protein